MKIIQDKKIQMYYVELSDGEKAYLKYRWEGIALAFYEIHVPDQFRNQGIEDMIISEAVEDTARSSLKIIPVCKEVKDWFTRNPHMQHVMFL